MPRKADPLFCRDGIYYARWYENGRRILLSLGTPDRIEANRRLPIIRSAKMSWDEFQRTTADYALHPTSLVSGLGSHVISPPVPIKGTRDGIKSLLEMALIEGWAKYNKKSGEWTIEVTSAQPEVNNDLLGGLQEVKRVLQGSNDTEQIQQFYRESVLQLYIDKKTASRFAEIWLSYLQQNSITSWAQITEKLCVEFRNWRKVTSQARNNQAGKPPSGLVVNRQFAFLDKSFELAIHKAYMTSNPIKFWRPENYQAPQKQGLTRNELEKVLNDPMWQRNFLMNGKQKVQLDFKLQDILIMLFASCKRRKEILRLNISNVYFKEGYVSYFETKNSSKGTSYSIQKAFYISKVIEKVLRKVIGDRNEGPLFLVPDVMKKDKDSSELGRINGDYFSELFKKCIEIHAPNKDITLHCLRHTATALLEEKGMTDSEIDDTLGHYNVKTALKNYQDRTFNVLATRLAKRTQKGIQILSDIVEKIII